MSTLFTSLSERDNTKEPSGHTAGNRFFMSFLALALNLMEIMGLICQSPTDFIRITGVQHL